MRKGLSVAISDLVYGVYERRLLRDLDPEQVPKHVGAIVDGNRRWAKGEGAEVADGYQAGADKIPEFLGWCEELGVEIVTLWLLSTENITRPEPEVTALLDAIERLVQRLTESGRWRLKLIGALDLIPDASAERLKEAVERSAGVEAMTVNIGVGYGGRQELADAMRSLLIEQAERGLSLDEVADVLDVEQIAQHLYTKGQPDPDLVIRTSGEQRLSGFLLWQSVYSEYYFCEALWPAFRRVDFLRAIRSYAARERRYGH